MAPPVPAEVTLLALINEQRTGAGCAALVADDALAGLAREHSAAMRDGGFVGVADPAGISLLSSGGRAAAVAKGDAHPAAVLTEWLDDPASGGPLLDCTMTSIGVGLVRGDDGPWWTALLA